jgi:hypothetical protein
MDGPADFGANDSGGTLGKGCLLMNALLICPSERSTVSPLSAQAPLANLPLLGQTLLEYWLSHLAVSGADRLLILSSDRTESIKTVVGSGSRWGLNVRVVSETRELTADEAVSKYGQELGAAPGMTTIEVLDHFPGFTQPRLFANYAEFFRALQVWMPYALTPDRVGMRQFSLGVWTGANSKISPEARVHAPCWIGQRSVIGSGAVLGPGSIVEDGAFIDTNAEVSASWIAPHTFVGRLVRVTNSLAWGNWLMNWQTGSATRIPDPFVLSALWQPSTSPRRSWIRRLADLYFRQKSEPPVPWNGLVVAEQKLTHESCPEH